MSRSPDADKRNGTDGSIAPSLAEKHAIVVIEHDMEFVRQIARIVTVLHEGTVIAKARLRMCRQMIRVREIYLGPKKWRMSAQGRET